MGHYNFGPNKTDIFIFGTIVCAALSVVPFIVWQGYKNNMNQQQNMAIAQQVYSKMAGTDRIVSPEESRDFLDAIGYKEPIHANDTVHLSPSSEGIEVVVGDNLENNGALLRGSDAKSGIRFPVSREALTDYLNQH